MSSNNNLMLFGANTPGRKNQTDQTLDHLTVSGKSVLQCTTLTASQKVVAPLADHQRVQCQTAVIGDISISGAGAITSDDCDIVCNGPFTVQANITGAAGTGIGLQAFEGDIRLQASGNLSGDIVITTENSTDGDIQVLAEGFVQIASGTAGAAENLTLTATGQLLGNGDSVTITGNTSGAGTGTIVISNTSDTANALQLHIPSAPVSNQASQLNIQNQGNTNAQGLHIRSDVGGILIDAIDNVAASIQLTSGTGAATSGSIIMNNTNITIQTRMPGGLRLLTTPASTLGFHGATPIAQQATPAPTAAAIIVALQALGLVA